MKHLSKFAFITVGILLFTLLFQSCSDNDDNLDIYYPNALVTVKHADDNTFYLQLDAETTLLPKNVVKSPYGDKEVRALVNFTELKGEDSKSYSKAVRINWIDSILTKPTVAFDLETEIDHIYGTDPVEIVNDWVTIAEDSYLTLRFRTVWGYTQKPHFVNLLTGVNEDNPYEIEFRHNAYGDTSGRTGDALVAFSLKDLPDTNGETVKLKLTWNSFSGKKSVEFDYKTNKETAGKLVLSNENNFIQAIN